jgi:opacity protein-like surface antigen
MSITARILTLAIAVMVFVPAAAKAQSPMSFGVKAGINMANVSSDVEEAELKRKTGFVAGLFATKEMNPNVGLQIEALYSMRGAKTDGPDETKINLNYIDVPVMARLGSQTTGGTKYYVITGPQLSLKVKGEVEFDGVAVDLEDDLKSTDFGWVIGAGVDMNRLTFDVRYTLGLTDIDTTDESVKNRTFSVMVGYRIK